MTEFTSAREAKEYIIQKILLQARNDKIPLSEIERKMLYFSENNWALPDMMDVSKEFDRHYSQDEFETKIGKLVATLKPSFNRDDENRWDEAVAILRQEDHYLLVLLDAPAEDVPRKDHPVTA